MPVIDLLLSAIRANMCTTERENTKKTEDAGMKVWTLGKFEEMEIGQKVLVARCGSGHSYFGEFGRLARTTSRQPHRWSEKQRKKAIG